MIEQLAYQGFPLVSKYYEGIAGLARKLAFKYGKVNQEEDFTQVALATACKMEKNYSKELGASFYTYINKPIKNEIQRAFGNPNRQTTSTRLFKLLSSLSIRPMVYTQMSTRFLRAQVLLALRFYQFTTINIERFLLILH